MQNIMGRGRPKNKHVTRMRSYRLNAKLLLRLQRAAKMARVTETAMVETAIHLLCP